MLRPLLVNFIKVDILLICLTAQLWCFSKVKEVMEAPWVVFLSAFFIMGYIVLALVIKELGGELLTQCDKRLPHHDGGQ